MRKINLQGQRFGRLIVVEEAERSKAGQARWRCLCDCGNETTVLGENLRNGGTKSCRCLASERAKETMAFLREKINKELCTEMTPGRIFNRLTVIGFYDVELSQKGTKRWLCQCVCGKEIVVRTNALVTGRTKSCGCWRKESRMLEPGIAMRNHLLLTYKHSAKRKKHEWSLDENMFDVLVMSNCHYCGALPSPRKDMKRFNGAFLCNGIDRKDSTKGYTPENTVPCCKICNIAKNVLPYDEFISYLKRAGRFQLGISVTGASV